MSKKHMQMQKRDLNTLALAPKRQLSRREQVAFEAGTTASRISLYTEMLAGLLLRVHDAYLFVQILPQIAASSDLADLLNKMGEHDGLRLDEQIIAAIWRLKGAVEDLKTIEAESLSARPSDPNYAFERELAAMALEVGTGVQRLINGNDGGKTLASALNKYASPEFQRKVSERRSRQMGKAGRPSRLAPETAIVGNRGLVLNAGADDMTYQAAAQIILNELSTAVEGTDEYKAHDKLLKKKYEIRGEYVRNCMKAVSEHEAQLGW